MMKTMIKRLLQGYLVGMANIIPGVSGGTLALVLGIYPRLLKALSNVDMAVLRSVVRALTLRTGWRHDVRTVWERVDAGFLALLGAGAVVGVFSLSRLMMVLLHQQLTLTYAFFFGLIMASIVFPYRVIRRLGPLEIGAFLAAGVVTVALSSAGADRAAERAIQRAARQAETQSAVETVEAPQTDAAERARPVVTLRMPAPGVALHIFAGAALAIAAMILPGVSGSFILLLLGVYFSLLRAVDERDVVLILIFMVGGLFGLLTLARIVNACLRRRFDTTMAAMIGLMGGSLWSLWPFKRYVILDGDLIFLGNRLPASAVEMGGAFLVFLLAVALIAVFLRWERRTAAGEADA